MNLSIHNDWNELLQMEFGKDYYKNLINFLDEEYKSEQIYPEKKDIFNAFNLTAFKDVKVVILGQDPYHGQGQAHGLSFSVQPGIKPPPSLKNIYKELHNDLGCYIPNNGHLVKWAEQGVMLLNTVLTVRAGQAHSHKNKGWEILTSRVIEILNDREDPVIFLLWGRLAQQEAKLINNTYHYILNATHPSPLSAYRGFLGSKHFSTTNELLKQLGKKTIDWQIENL